MVENLYIGNNPKGATELIKKFNADPDSNSGIVTVPKVIGAGESVTIPAGRVAVLPNVQVDGTLNIEGEVFIPTGATFSKVVETEGDQDIDGIKTFIESPIVPTPTTGTQVANKDYVDDSAIGVGQTWQDVKSSRSKGVTYTNNTGKPIFVSVVAFRSTGGRPGVTIMVDEIAVTSFFNLTAPSGTTQTSYVGAVVPNGSTYYVKEYNVSSSSDIESWAELR